MASRTALVDPGGQVALLGNRIGHFRFEQQPAGARFRALTDRELNPVGHPHVMNVDAVAGGQDLIDQHAAVLALGGQHAAIAGRVRRADGRGALGERHLRVVGKRPPAHPRDHDGDVKFDRLFGKARPQHGFRGAFFAVPLEGNAGQGAGQKGEIIECRPAPFAQRSVTADAVDATLGLGLNVIDDS